MGGARALIASLGASISLVAGAALSLLVVSFVFAYPGFVGGVDVPPSVASLDLGSKSSSAASRPDAAPRASAPVVIKPAPAATRGPAAKVSASRPVRSGAPEPASTDPSFNPGVRTFDPATPPPPPAQPQAEREPQVGDGVREVGDAVSATVHGTGLAATPLLGPPVSKAVQDVLDLLTSVLQGATGALAGVLDAAVPVR